MSLTRWAQRVMWSAAASATALAVAMPSGALGQATTPTLNVAQAQAADLTSQLGVLNDPAADNRARDEAARRLVSRQTPQARQLLLGVLVNFGNQRGQLAVARALTGDTSAEPAFIDPLFALIGTSRELSDAACQALMAYKANPAVSNRLLELAQNANAHPNARIAATLAVGGFADKRVAKGLIDLTRSEAESAALRNAAADALGVMTGLTENSRDANRWAKWWVGQSAKTDAGFRDDLLVQRSTRVDDLIARQQQLSDELQSLLTEQYQAAPDAGKDALLLKWMHSAEPQVRVVAARFVIEDFQNNRQTGAAVKEYLRTLIGDSSPAVRLQVARTQRVLNDPAALDTLLIQVSQEPVSEIRAAIVVILGRLEDVKAAPEVEKLLNDESLAVAEAAAEALTKLGPKLRERDQPASLALARKIRTVLEERAGAPGAERLRESLVEALVPLRDPDALKLYFRLLNLRETERVRRAAVRGIAALKDPNAADVVVAWLKNETVAAVRLECIIAIGETSKTEHFETLYERMWPAGESDAAVRDRAWLVFASLLPQASTEQVNRWTTRFQADPTKRVIVLKSLADKLAEDKNLDELAKTRQSIGETLMKSSPSQPEEAAKYFRESLDFYRKQQGTPDQILETLNGQHLDALLQSRKYADVTAFAKEIIATNPGNQQEVGGKIKVEAERLRDTGDLQNAMNLITEAKAMNPPLPKLYSDTLDDIARQIQMLISKQNQKNGTMGPAGDLPGIES